jgi:hypothetical protein
VISFITVLILPDRLKKDDASKSGSLLELRHFLAGAAPKCLLYTVRYRFAKKRFKGIVSRDLEGACSFAIEIAFSCQDF